MEITPSRAVAVVLFLAVAILRIAAGGKAERELPGGTVGDSAGVVFYLSGEVFLDGKATEIGAPVLSGATLETKNSSLCEIRFGDRNIFQIRENTLATLSLSGGGREVDLKKGAFAAVFDKLKTVAAEGRDGFRLRTPTAVGGVRGTVFFFQVESEDSTYVCICNGRIDLEDVAAGNRIAAEADRHKALRFIRGAGGTTTEAAPLLYHTDADMDTLAAKIQVTIPWGPGYGR
jgi:hypothetical protein